jgi:hypothetical protein
VANAMATPNIKRTTLRFIKKSSKLPNWNIGLRRLPAVLALHTQFTGPTIETPGGGFRKSPKHFGTRKLARLNSMGSPDYLGW